MPKTQSWDEQVMPEPNTGCLLWLGRINQGGYGQTSVKGRQSGAHRVAWERERGEIPSGLLVMHKCDTRPCVNVEHLRLGTAADNSADMFAKGRSIWQRFGIPVNPKPVKKTIREEPISSKQQVQMHPLLGWYNDDGPMGLINIGAVDIVITDPPYDPRVDQNNAAERIRAPGTFGFDPMNDTLRNRAAIAIATTCCRWALVFCAYEEIHLWKDALESAGMYYWQTGHWHREGAKPQMTGRGPAQASEAIVICHGRHLEQRWNGGGKVAAWSAPVVRGDERCHPTQKPTVLMKELVTDFSDPGDLIADPFGGVASTGIAALGSGRRFVGWEIDSTHHATGKLRLSSPLIDRIEHQQPMFAQSEVPVKGHIARARMQMSREILALGRRRSDQGFGVSDVTSLLQSTEREAARALQRLIQSGALRREGRTSSTRYFIIDAEKIEIEGERS